MAHINTFIPEFDQFERFYREYYLSHPEAHIDSAQSLNEIHHSIPEIETVRSIFELQPADILKEIELPGYADVNIHRHLRYSPAFLHSHTFFEIICVFRGNCQNVFSADSLSMKAGDICIVAPGTVHALSVFEDDCIVYNLMVRSATFEHVFLSSLPPEGILYSFFSKALFLPDKDAFLYIKNAGEEKLCQIFDEILEEYHRQKSYYNNLINSLLTIFFIILLRRHEKDMILPNPSGRKQEKNMIFIFKYIEQHADSLTLKELSDFFNYSERQMARILKDYTGQTFTELIQKTRMAKTCSLLKNPDIPMSDIINASGYSNSSHFYNTFKKIYHMTPAQYRKKYEKETKIV